MRLVAGAVLGGLAMFVWGSISHMALPLGYFACQVLDSAVGAAIAGLVLARVVKGG